MCIAPASITARLFLPPRCLSRPMCSFLSFALWSRSSCPSLAPHVLYNYKNFGRYTQALACCVVKAPPFLWKLGQNLMLRISNLPLDWKHVIFGRDVRYHFGITSSAVFRAHVPLSYLPLELIRGYFSFLR